MRKLASSQTLNPAELADLQAPLSNIVQEEDLKRRR
jgi:hypothetical protein